MSGSQPEAHLTSDHLPAADRLRGAALFSFGLLQIGLIALVDYATGPWLSCSIFYLVPVAFGARFGGFSHGIVLALAGTAAWQLIDQSERPDMAPVIRAWNGIVHFATLALLCSLFSRLEAGLRREQRLARTDSLTGAANARTFYEAAAAAADRAVAAGRPLTVAYLDLDDFKRLNDLQGHAAGDEALKFLVQTVQQHVRRGDLLARLGGDEFALLLPGAGPDDALPMLRRIQALLAREMAGRGWPVTLSAGAITFLKPASGVDVMIQQVDALRYGAKRQGKGRIESAVVSDDPDAGSRPRERRAAARVLCSRAARDLQDCELRPREETATVRDISTRGVAVQLEAPVPLGTVLIVEPLADGARPLVARVVRVEQGEGGWVHGCSLSLSLGADEMAWWLSSAAAPSELLGAAR
ncbi:MAG: GGDEF domain-containing protein [Gemmataceae bacterium]